MEGIIFVIIIIIAFNLLNVFLKVIRGKRGGQRKDIPTGIEYPTVDEVEAKKPEDATFDQKSDDESHNEYMDVADEYAVSSPGESDKPSKVASNLKKMFSQKESLAAAVIVHEILNHPLAMRRKR